MVDDPDGYNPVILKDFLKLLLPINISDWINENMKKLFV